jgi:hypothetical protein
MSTPPDEGCAELHTSKRKYVASPHFLPLRVHFAIVAIEHVVAGFSPRSDFRTTLCSTGNAGWRLRA